MFLRPPQIRGNHSGLSAPAVVVDIGKESDNMCKNLFYIFPPPHHQHYHHHRRHIQSVFIQSFPRQRYLLFVYSLNHQSTSSRSSELGGNDDCEDNNDHDGDVLCMLPNIKVGWGQSSLISRTWSWNRIEMNQNSNQGGQTFRMQHLFLEVFHFSSFVIKYKSFFCNLCQLCVAQEIFPCQKTSSCRTYISVELEKEPLVSYKFWSWNTIW